jgi:hypothetical protein
VETHEWAARNGAEFVIIPRPARRPATFHIARLSARLPFVDVPRA